MSDRAESRGAPAGPAGIRPIGFARWSSDQPSGGNRYDEQLLIHLRALGWDVREQHVTGSWPTPSAADVAKLESLLTTQPEWLIGNIVASAAPSVIEAARIQGTRITLLMHYFPADDATLDDAARRSLTRTERRTVQAASAVIATSAWAAAQVRMRYGRADVAVAVPGTDPAPMAAGSRDTGRPMMLWLGRLSVSKDPLTFIDALHGVRDLSFRAKLVGSDTADTATARATRERVEEAELADRVEIAGAQRGAALDETWSRTDLLVHTSRAETYGMVIAEAVARGIPPVVAWGTGATGAAAGAGAAFPPGDAAALSRILRDWLTDVRVQQQWRAAAARRRSMLPRWVDTARAVAAVLRH